MSRNVAIDELDKLIEEQAALDSELERIKFLCDAILVGWPRNLSHMDPFTSSYFDAVLSLYKQISGRDEYRAESSELSPYLEDMNKKFKPGIYTYNSSSFLGGFFIAFGAIMKVLNVNTSSVILEYGAGDGQISLALARMGCKVSVIDVEQKYLHLIKAQAAALGVIVDTMQGVFGDGFPDNRKFDCVLFFEAFHPALNHQDVLARIRDLLKPGGRIIFAGEPIVDADGVWAQAVPFPWGPRLDGLSARAMRVYGWCELGFQRSYFIELLLRSGFELEYIDCSLDGRGACYVASLLKNGRLSFTRTTLLSISEDSRGGWHGAEDGYRWTSERSILPLARGYRSGTLELSNPLPTQKYLSLRVLGNSKSISMAPFSSMAVEVDIPPRGGRLVIECNTNRPSEIADSSDDRDLGIQVHSITYS